MSVPPSNCRETGLENLSPGTRHIPAPVDDPHARRSCTVLNRRRGHNDLAAVQLTNAVGRKNHERPLEGDEAILLRQKVPSGLSFARPNGMSRSCLRLGVCSYCDIPPVLCPALVSIEIKKAFRSAYENLWPAISARCSMDL